MVLLIIEVNIRLFSTYHLLELSTMTPLSTEKLSVGKPAMFHALILIGSPRVLLREKSSEHGIFLDCKRKDRDKLLSMYNVQITQFNPCLIYNTAINLNWNLIFKCHAQYFLICIFAKKEEIGSHITLPKHSLGFKYKGSPTQAHYQTQCTHLHEDTWCGN